MMAWVGRRVWATAAVVAGLAAGQVRCGSSVFGCTEDAQCEGAGGVCASPGFCAFDDPDCASGLAYGDLAGDPLAGTCVAVEGTGSSSETSAGVGTMSMTDAVLTTDAGDDDTTMGIGATSDAATSVATSAGSTTDGSTGDAGSSSDTGPATQTATFPASYAACGLLDAATPEPATCAGQSGMNAFTVDAEVFSAAMPGGAAGFLIIPVGSRFVGHTVVEARLVLHTTAMGSSDSNQSGELWLVEPFDETTLQMVLPAPLGGGPLAPDQGPVAVDDVVAFVLPSDAIGPDADLYLGIFPSTPNGVDYDDHNGEQPPRIEIDYLP